METWVTFLQARTVDMVAVGSIKTISTAICTCNAVFIMVAFCQNTLKVKKREISCKICSIIQSSTQCVLVKLLSKLRVRSIYYSWILSKQKCENEKSFHVILFTPRHQYPMCPCNINWSLRTKLLFSIQVVCCKLIWKDNTENTFVYSLNDHLYPRKKMDHS